MSNFIYKKRSQRIRRKLKQNSKGRFRLTVFRSAKNISAQSIDDKIKKVITDIKLEEAAIAHRQNVVEDAAPQVSVAT